MVDGGKGSWCWVGTVVGWDWFMIKDWSSVREISMERLKRSKLLYTVLVRVYRVQFTHWQSPLKDSDPIFMEISWMHERIDAKTDCDAFLIWMWDALLSSFWRLTLHKRVCDFWNGSRWFSNWSGEAWIPFYLFINTHVDQAPELRIN